MIFPPWATIAWATDDGVSIALPLRGGEAYHVMSFAKTEAGLTQALNVLRNAKEPPKATKAAPITRPRTFSPEQQANAKAIMRKLGMVW